MGKTIVLTNEANSYFFPSLENVEFVFKYPNSKLYLTFMKVMREMKIPLLNMFFGKWYIDVKNIDRIIIFDLGYQPKMEDYIFIKNRNCKIYYFNWNNIDNKRKLMKIDCFYDRNRVFTMDYADSIKYGINYCSTFYSIEWTKRVFKEQRQIKNSVFWLGQNKGRAANLKRLSDILKTFEINTDIRIVDDSAGIFKISDRMDYYSYCIEMVNCKYIIDITQEGQTGPTLRVMESLFFNKKLITNNSFVKSMDIFNENNILVINADNPDVDSIAKFIRKEYQDISDEIKGKYEFKEWLLNFNS